MTDREFTHAAVIGTGMMGPGIALTLALGGLRDHHPEPHRRKCRRAAWKKRARRRACWPITTWWHQPAYGGRAELLSASTAFDETVAAAGLVVESGPEDMAFKQEFFARMDARGAGRDAVAGVEHLRV